MLEKALAEKAGLGWMGKHTLLLEPRRRLLFLSRRDLHEPAAAADAPRPEDHCGSCNACITVCPTNAIVGPKQVDARRCISYLTIEHRGSIPEALRKPIGNRVFGCDDCQLFCPWNRYAQPTARTRLCATQRPRRREPPGAASSWTEDEFLKRTEGSAMRRISYEQWQRNLAVALGNGEPSAAVIEALRARRAIRTPMVAEHIDWALRARPRKSVTPDE